jgi:hypothetical protein
MARRSFTVRRITGEGGSYLQYEPEATPILNITAAVHYPGYATQSYTTDKPHGFVAGDTVEIIGTTPDSYSYKGVISGVGTNSFFFVYVNNNPKSTLGADGSTTYTASGTSASVTGTWSMVKPSSANYEGSGGIFTIEKTGSGNDYDSNTTVTLTPLRTNLCPNPSFEGSASAGWTPFQSSLTRVEGTIAGGTGSYSASSVSSVTGQYGPFFQYFTPTIGSTLTVSGYCLRTVGSRSYRWDMQFYNGATFISFASGTASTCATSTRLSVTGTVPAGTTNVLIILTSTGSGSAGDSHQIDSVLLEKSSTVNSYFDGSTDLGVNLCPNPTFETDTTGWLGALANIARITSASYIGTACLSVTSTSATDYLTRTAYDPNTPIGPGVQITASAYVYNFAGNDRQHRLDLRCWNGTTLDSTITGTVTTINVGSGWTRLSVTGTTSSNTDNIDIVIYTQLNNQSLSNVSYVDAVLIEESSTLNNYFGELINDKTNWTGTVNNSTSTITNGGANYRVGETIVIPGTSLGGTSANNLNLLVATKADGLYVSGGVARRKISKFGKVYTSSNTSSASATYIKGDNVQTAPVLSTALVAGNTLSNAAFFDATPTDYQQVTITWGLTLYELGVTAEPYSVHIVYSPIGCPDTIAEGSVLLETRTIEEYIHTGITGEWAYYTMFIRYRSNNGDDYYEPVSKLEVLVPSNYGSTESLYSKIPMYYQYQDEIGTGDLKKYLSIFGWDVDKFRTTLDFAMSMKDPWVANEETLDYIAADLGAGVTVSDLGSQRLRDLLTILSNSRKKNGTGSSIEQFLEAIVGANVEINDTAKTIKVYSQRVNLIKDPKFFWGVAAGVEGGGPSDNSAVVYDSGEVGTAQATTVDGGLCNTVSSAATPTTENWLSFTSPNNFSHDILETVGADVKVIGGDVFYFSINIPNIAGGEPDVPGAIDNVAIYNSSGIAGGSTSLIALDSEPQTFGNTKYWRIVIPDTVTTYTNAKLTIEYNTSYNSNSISYSDFKYILLERNYIGKYFDGDTVEGGWLLSGNGSTGSISDYRWLGSPSNSFSVYTTNWKKTTQIVSRLLKDLLPVRETISSGTLYSNGYYKTTVGNPVKTPNYKYTITYDKIPGDT